MILLEKQSKSYLILGKIMVDHGVHCGFFAVAFIQHVLRFNHNLVASNVIVLGKNYG